MDLVEYEFSPFKPGENINTIGLEKEYTLLPESKKVTVTVPGRIHLNVLDMNRFAPDRPGGGGIGFAIQIYCSADVECTPSGIEIEYEREPIIRHFTEVFTQTVGYTGGFRISVRDHERKHVGLGSTGSVLLAVGHAMNKALGSPLTPKEIRLLIGYNYVEETVNGEVAFGFETGVGPAVATYGGMAVLGDKLTLVSHQPFAKGKNVFIVIPPTEASAAGEHEFNLLMNRARTLDYRDRELKSYLVLMDLIPALECDELSKIGDVIWEMDFRGSKRAEVEHNSFEIYYFMSRIRDAGIEFVGMSSVGPSIAIVTEKSKQEVSDILAAIGLEIAIATKTDNDGLRISYNGGIIDEEGE